MGMLKYSLIICIDFLAWPLIALAYPLFASIRAVDSGSKYHMTKLVKYWILFALISLFEFCFAKIILWIPWWPRIRLALLLWLVLPQFDGASYAYQTLHLLEAVLNMLTPRTRELYIKQNLENLIATKECNRDVKFTEAEKIAAAATIQQVEQVNETLETPAPAPAPPLEKPPKQEWTCHLCNVKTSSEHNLNAHLKGRIHKSNCESFKAKVTGPCKDKPKKQVNETLERPAPAPPLEKPPKQEWTCRLCNVRTSSENNLNAHLKGRLHKSNCASFKAKDTGPSYQCKDKSKKQVNETLESPAPPLEKPPEQEWNCDLCNVRTTSENDLNAHLKGRIHKSNCESFKAKETGPSYQCKDKPKKHDAARPNQIITRHCLVCDAKLPTDIQLASHLKGNRHLSNIKNMANLQ